MSKTNSKVEANLSNSTNDSIADPLVTVTMLNACGNESSPPANEQLSDSREEVIRLLAHRKWSTAGCPTGDGIEFWLEAEREVDAERAVLNRIQE